MGEIKDRKDIVNHTIWVRWAFLFTLVTFIVFLTVVVFDSPDKNKIIIAAVFHALFVSFYNIIHLIIYKKERADNTIRNLSDGLIVLDNQNMITLMNPEAEKILVIKSEEAVGKKVSLEMFSSPKFQNLSRIVLIKKEEVAGETRPVEVNLEKPEKLTLQVISAPILDLNKKAVGTMKILHNISREKEISRMKSEFISIAAHQLRTPLSAVKWTFK